MANKLRMTSGSEHINLPARKEDANAQSSTRYEIDLLSLMRLFLARRRWIVGITTAVTAVAVIMMLMAPNLYQSSALILPSGKTDNLSALKAMAGLGGMGMQSENSSALFPLILSSNLIRDAVLDKEYTYSPTGVSEPISLKEYLGRTDPDRLRLGLAGITSISKNTRTGEIRLGVETKYPELSQAIVSEYLVQLEEYNLHKRSSSAKKNELYLASQLAGMESQLVKAEQDLLDFRLANANWAETTNPTILTSQARLKREVQIRSTASQFLQEQYEMARFEAQKDIPIVRILDMPNLPTQKSGPFRTIIVISTAIITFAIVILLVILVDLISQYLRGSEPNQIDDTGADFRRAFPRTVRVMAAIRPRTDKSPISVDS